MLNKLRDLLNKFRKKSTSSEEKGTLENIQKSRDLIIANSERNSTFTVSPPRRRKKRIWVKHRKKIFRRHKTNFNRKHITLRLKKTEPKKITGPDFVKLLIDSGWSAESAVRKERELLERNDGSYEDIYRLKLRELEEKQRYGRTKSVEEPDNHVDSVIETEKKEIEKYSDFLKDLGDNFEQKRAVVSDSKRILVLAGAGSGKTKVLTKRFIHLVNNKGVSKDEILAVTFTRDATKEMIERISSGLNMESMNLHESIRTFHSFCMHILRQNEQFDVISEIEQREIIQDIIYCFRDDARIMQNMYDYLRDNILEKVKNKDNERSRDPQVKAKPTGFGEPKIKTEAGILVRSKSERDIANFLTSLGLNWIYEQPVNFGEGEFRPDFTINGDIFIEHWCYTDDTPEFDKINKGSYLKHRKWKEEQYKKHGKILISIDEAEMLDLQRLQVRLKAELEKELNQELQQKTVLELLKLSPLYERAYNQFIDELIEVTNLVKSQLLTVDEVKQRVKKQEKEKVLCFYNVLIPVMEVYEKTLRTKGFGKKDFNDLIKDAVNLLKKDHSRCDYYSNKIKYLLVDEFQDVSYGIVELLKLLIKRDTSFFAVGDDWQSIYGWRGSEVRYILTFENIFGTTEKIILPVNYRSTKNIVDASSHFIQLSKNQYKKDIHCSKENGYQNFKIVQVNASDDFNAARYIVWKTKTLMKEDVKLKFSDFLILTRSSKNVTLYKKEFIRRDFKMPIRTIHSAKGTEYKYVFVVGLKGGTYGFPTVYADKDIKRVILDIPIEDKMEEERRIFYVAMTRAKNELFLMSELGNESEFLKDIPLEYKVLQKWVTFY